MNRIFITRYSQAWDADKGINSEIRYSLLGAEATKVFALDPETGDLSLKRSLRDSVGKSYDLRVTARDSRGERVGLESTIDVVVHVLSPEFQLSVLLDNEPGSVMEDLTNITKSLSKLSGFEVRILNSNFCTSHSANLG